MSKIALLIGSSRSSGNTRIIVDQYLKLDSKAQVFDLNDYQIGYYDYNFKNADDDFLKLFQDLLEFDVIIFATPIYWYTMSAQMKTFFDRISDMLHGENKKLGRLLRGKSMAVISCGSDAEIFEGFEMPFRESANYLGMNYKGHAHTWLNDNSEISDEVLNRLKKIVI
jgi:multimeric flavodoxin WrbA